MKWAPFLVSLLSLLVQQCHVDAIWTGFDFVRPRAGAWGSTGIIPFIKFNGSVPSGSFGSAVANIGDIDGNGFDDIVVGAVGEDSIDRNGATVFKAGSIYVMLMNETGGMISSTRISGYDSLNGGPELSAADQFGFSLCGVGDLDGDSVPDIAVGAPGPILSAVYVLFMNRNATVKSSRMIRGEFIGSALPGNATTNGTVPIPVSNSTNGPPISYGSRFGVSLANIGDFNNDGVVDIAVGAIDASSGQGFVYLLFLDTHATVANYTTIGSGIGGGPLMTTTFASFGSAVLRVGDLDRDNVTDLAIGVMDFEEANSLNTNAGGVYVCLMHANGTVKQYTRISEYAELSRGEETGLFPVVSNDQCGAALATIGDINLDDRRQRRPDLFANPPRLPVPDLVIGCPQGNTGVLPGRFFLAFLNNVGAMMNYRALPAESDAVVGPQLRPVDQFGRALARYYDVDNNGLDEIIVGAPGDDEGGLSAGAVYIVFLRRRRYHGPRFPFVRFIVLVTVLPAFCAACMIVSVMWFLWRFRRMPDQAEIIVKESGMTVDPKRKRPKFVKMNNQVYAEEYTL